MDAAPAPLPLSPEAQAERTAEETRKWIMEIEASEKAQRKWLTRARKIAKLYKQEDEQTDGKRKFAMLWSNTQTVHPAVYARPPQPVVSRRFRDADPVGRAASEVLERSLKYTGDKGDRDGVLKAASLDFVLFARGQTWVRYVPTFGPEVTPEIELQVKTTGADDCDDEEGEGADHEAAEALYEDEDGAEYSGEQVQFRDDGTAYAQGEPYRPVVWEKVVTDYVNWEDFGHNVARTWDEVDTVWRRTYLNRKQLRERFGREIGDKVTLDWGPNKAGKAAEEGPAKRAAVYEVWCKSEKKVYWISKSYNQAPLDVRDDPLGLEGFFPCPRPLLGTLANDSLLPTPDYVYYQHQADEINSLTAKIDTLEKSLKVAGFYAASDKTNLEALFKAANSVLIPVPDWIKLKEGGGVGGNIEWFPIQQVVAALQAMIELRTQIINDVYQITGIADLMRGMNDPRATATAEAMKGQWGTMRIRERQKEMQRFARDILAIEGEVIAEKFDISTLREMTALQLPTMAEKQALQQQLAAQAQQAQMATQQAQAAQMAQGPMPGGPMMGHNGGPPMAPAPEPTPEQQRMLEAPTWEEVVQRLRDNAKRQFTIDIETDSTIEPNESEEKGQAVEFIGAVGNMIAQWGPAIEARPELAPMASEFIKWGARKFRAGREMEDVIEQAMERVGQALAQPKPDGADAEKQAKAADAQVKLQAAAMKQQTDMAKMQRDDQKAQMEFQIDSADLQLRARQQELDAVALTRDPNPQVIQ